MLGNYWVSAHHSEGPPFRRAAILKGPPFSAISSSDNLQLGIRLGLGQSSGCGNIKNCSMQRPCMTAFRMADLSKWRTGTGCARYGNGVSGKPGKNVRELHSAWRSVSHAHDVSVCVLLGLLSFV